MVTFSLYTNFDNYTTFTPDPEHFERLSVQLDQIAVWATALRDVRQIEAASAAVQ